MIQALLSIILMLTQADAAEKSPSKEAGTQPTAAAAEEILPPTSSAAALLSEAFGADGLENLAAKGYLVLQGGKTGLRLELAQWKALRDIAAVGPAVADFSAAHERFLGDNPVAEPGAALGFSALSRLPPSGLMTPTLHALAQGLSAIHAEVSALSGSGDALSDPAEPLFSTKWGKNFAARTNADLNSDPGSLLKPYFDSYLGGIRPSDDAVKHFLGFLAHSYKFDAAALLDKDAKNGSPSEELRVWLRKYLSDQRRLYALKRARESVKEISSRKGAMQELKNLKAAAQVLAEKPGLLESARLKLAETGPASRVTLTSSGLHYQKPTRLGRHELGDNVIVSGAYWVDGLAEGEKAAVDETVLTDKEHEGFVDTLTKTELRVNGGPYTFTRTLTLKDSRNLAVRAVIGTAKAKSRQESLDIPVAEDFEKALRRLSQAENLVLECNFKDAESVFTQFEQDYAEAASQKKQYAELVATAASSKRSAVKHASALAKLDESLSELRADSSPQQCRYDLKRVEAAVKAVRSLPAGCDSRLGELSMERRTIARRADDQRFALMSLEKARSQKKACGFSASVESYLNALSVLDADPAARCGAAEETASAAESELLQVRLQEMRLAVSDRELKIAAEDPEATSSLKRLRSLIAANSGMNAAECFQKDILEAVRLADKFGDSIPVPSESDVAKILPEDKTLASASREVEEERRRIQAAEEAAKAKELAEQAPQAPEAPATRSDDALEDLLKKDSGEAPPVQVTEEKAPSVKEIVRKKASKPARKTKSKKKSAEGS